MEFFQPKKQKKIERKKENRELKEGICKCLHLLNVNYCWNGKVFNAGCNGQLFPADPIFSSFPIEKLILHITGTKWFFFSLVLNGGYELPCFVDRNGIQTRGIYTVECLKDQRVRSGRVVNKTTEDADG